MPALPRDLFIIYTEQLELSEYDANIIVENKQIALFFESVLTFTSHVKLAANLLMGEIKAYLNQNAVEIEDFPITPKRISELIELIQSGKVSYSVASNKIFPQMILERLKSPFEIATELNVIQE